MTMTGTLEMTEDWSALDSIYGGYVVARSIELLSCVDDFVPLSVTTQFLGRLQPGPVESDVRVVHRGARTATVTASLTQGHPRLSAVAKLGARHGEDRTPRLDVSRLARPEVVEPATGPYGVLAYGAQVEVRDLPSPTGDPATGARAWVKVQSPAAAADRLADVCLAPLFLDTLAPGTWYAEGFEGFAPTIDLTAHLGRRQATYDEWHLVEQRTVLVGDDCWVEDATLHDRDGGPIAVARQTRRTIRHGVTP